jgi:hypothetical protein
MGLEGSAKRLKNGFGGNTAGVAAKGLKIKKAEFLPPFLPQIFCANRQN